MIIGEGREQRASRFADRSAARGCYGLNFDSLPESAHQLVRAEDSAPVLHISRRGNLPESSTRFEVTHTYASLPLSDSRSRVDLDRASGTAILSLCRDYSDEALLHPLLSGSCAIMNWWHGRDAFHAGAFEVDGRAWVVIGDKGQGKSTTLGHLALQGVPVLSDDLVVIDDDHVLPGPAFIDLRPDAAERLGAGRDMGWLGARPRFRLDVPRARPRVPLAGWLVLAWDDESTTGPSLRPVPLVDRLPFLFHNRAVRLDAATPAAFVQHMTKPFLELARPKRWESLAQLASVLESLPR